MEGAAAGRDNYGSTAGPTADEPTVRVLGTRGLSEEETNHKEVTFGHGNVGLSSSL